MSKNAYLALETLLLMPMKAAARIHHFLLVMVLLWSLCSVAQDTIQVRVTGGEVLVPVQIDGRSLNFLLDTGVLLQRLIQLWPAH